MMKPGFIIALLCPLLLISSVLFAQENKTLGIKGGISFSNFWGPNAQNLSDQVRAAVPGAIPTNNLWFTVSAFTSRDLLPNILTLQSEIVYTRDGSVWKTGDQTFGFHIDYLRIPWLLKFSLPYAVKPSMYVGPQISFMFRSRLEDVPTARIPALTMQTFFIPAANGVRGEDYDQFTNVVDLGLATGIELSTLIGLGSLVLDLRYNLDGVNTFNYSAGSGVRNYDFLIMLGYALNFGGSY